MPNAPAAPAVLIGGLYSVDASHPLRDAGDTPAFAATRAGVTDAFAAFEVAADKPARSAVLEVLLANPVDGVLNPLAHGPAELPARKPGYYVITPAPPGPSLVGARAWTESELVEYVLRPVAATLARLEGEGVTHRGIHPGNVFRAPGAPVVLGCAWAFPPASTQPALYASPAVALSHPNGRGEGSVAEDVYSLGVLLLTLALGHEPLAGLDPAHVVARKIELGSFSALTRGVRLPAELADIVRIMLADEPTRRPRPSFFVDPRRSLARAPARRQRRAVEPLVLAGVAASDAKALAAAMANAPDEALRDLRLRRIDRWLRHDLDNPALAHRIEEVVQDRVGGSAGAQSDAMVVLQAIALTDPSAPLTWRGVTFFPDGLGPLLVVRELEPVLTELIESEALALWAARRSSGEAQMIRRLAARRYRALLNRPGWSGGLGRLRYTLNPLLPCLSPILSPHRPTTLASLLEALEALAGQDDARPTAPIDKEIAGFILARGGDPLEAELRGLPGQPDAGAYGLSLLRIFAAVQTLARVGSLPHLSRWLLGCAKPTIATWHEKSARERLERRLSELADLGDIPAIVPLLDDPPGHACDTAGLRRAEGAVRRIDAELDRIAAGGERRADAATRLGQELVAAIGLAALAGTLLTLALG